MAGAVILLTEEEKSFLAYHAINAYETPSRRILFNRRVAHGSAQNLTSFLEKIIKENTLVIKAVQLLSG